MRLFITATLLFGLVGSAGAIDKANVDKRIRTLTAKLQEMQAKPDERVPAENLRKAKGIILLDRAQIECLVIGLGPGSYNGIRLAIASAQGWQLAREVKLLGISTVEGLAAEAQAEGVFGRVHIVIDAQRGEFYVAGYDLSAQTSREIEPLRLATLAEVQACQQAGGIIVGPEVTNWFPGSRVLFPRAATLGRMARGRADFVPGEKLEPIYLRATQFVKAPPPRIVPF